MKNPEIDLAYQMFKLVGDGPFPSYCDDLDEEDFTDEQPEEAQIAQPQPPFLRRRQDYRWR